MADMAPWLNTKSSAGPSEKPNNEVSPCPQNADSHQKLMHISNKHLHPALPIYPTTAELDNDSDLKIESAKQSFNCRITLHPFTHLITSSVYPHSFEKVATGLMLA